MIRTILSPLSSLVVCTAMLSVREGLTNSLYFDAASDAAGTCNEQVDPRGTVLAGAATIEAWVYFPEGNSGLGDLYNEWAHCRGFAAASAAHATKPMQDAMRSRPAGSGLAGLATVAVCAAMVAQSAFARRSAQRRRQLRR